MKRVLLLTLFLTFILKIDAYCFQNKVSEQDSLGPIPSGSVLLAGGIDLSLGKPLRNVYGFGFHLQLRVPIFLTNRIVIEPIFSHDHFKKKVNSTTATMQLGWNIGIGTSYFMKISNEGLYFNPGLAVHYGKVSDMLVPNKIIPTESIGIVNGTGISFEIASNFVKDRFFFGVSYVLFNPNVTYSQELLDDLNSFNEVHEVLTVTPPAKLNLSKLRLNFGYYIK